MRATQILDPFHLLSNRVLGKRRVLSDNRESCAWSCGALSRPLRGGANVGSESSTSCRELRPLGTAFGIVRFVIVGALCPCTVCCHTSSACCLGCFFAGAVELWVLSRQGCRGRRRRLPQLKYPVALRRGCSGKSPAVADSRIMSRIRNQGSEVCCTSNISGPFVTKT